MEPVELGDHAWRQIYVDELYGVSIDVEHVGVAPDAKTFVVWYQTERFEMQYEDGVPWNREVIRSLLRCDPLQFTTIRVTVFLDSGPPVAQIGGADADADTLAWRDAIPGSVDESSMVEACRVLRE